MQTFDDRRCIDQISFTQITRNERIDCLQQDFWRLFQPFRLNSNCCHFDRVPV